MAAAVRQIKARSWWISLAFIAAMVALPGHSGASVCGDELSAFERVTGAHPHRIVAARPVFPPSGEAEILLVVSSLFRAAQSMELLGNVNECLELVGEARAKFESAVLGTPLQ